MPVADLPIIYGSSSGLYPLVITISFDTLVSQFRGGQQQRSVMRQPLVKIGQNIDRLTRAQKDQYKQVFMTSLGQQNTTLSMLLFGTNFANFSFDSDEFSATETKIGQYSVSFNLTQTHTGGLSPGVSGQAFPLLTNNAMGILPYTQHVRFASDVAMVESGAKYTWAWYGAGLQNCATRGLIAVDFDEQDLTDADLAIRMNHFIANWGRKYSFPYADEDGTVYPNCHYASDELVMTLIEPNRVSCKTSIEETWGAPS